MSKYHKDSHGFLVEDDSGLPGRVVFKVIAVTFATDDFHDVVQYLAVCSQVRCPFG